MEAKNLNLIKNNKSRKLPVDWYYILRIMN
jgi:hypothetical protein